MFSNNVQTLSDFIDESVPDVPKIPKATNGEDFPWDDVRLVLFQFESFPNFYLKLISNVQSRLPIFIRPVSYDLELTPNLTTLEVKGIIKLIFRVRKLKLKTKKS